MIRQSSQTQKIYSITLHGRHFFDRGNLYKKNVPYDDISSAQSHAKIFHDFLWNRKLS